MFELASLNDHYLAGLEARHTAEELLPFREYADEWYYAAYAVLCASTNW